MENETSLFFEAFTKEEFARRLHRLQNVLNSNDISFEAAGKCTDPLPILISAGEWKLLEAGLAQRARLFNALAKDMYGEQRLWKQGKLPAALLFANPDFMQVAWKVKPACDIYVHLAASDIVRTKDGSFYVTRDHLQVPDGLGRALENRLGVSRAFPELFRSLCAERLAGFFKKLLDCLGALQNGNGQVASDGKIVMLASGPESERRSEDAMLARYLGIPLVENDDLAVRKLQVYMKTLVGLKKIGTIFRRVEDGMCDPLELKEDSGEGAVGLISTVRAGNVAMSNFLGSGALETPMFKPFLPYICKELLGEDLLLQDVPCVWLGDRGKAASVLAEPAKWSFRKTFGNEPAKHYAKLTVTGQLSLLQAIEENPESYVAELSLDSVMVPVLRNGALAAAEVSMRFFSVNTPTETSVMPGGFGSFKVPGNFGESLLSGEKDIWVLAEHPVANFSLLAPADLAVTPSRAGGDLPSRAAENLYKLGRALAAANAMARIARSIAVRLSDEAWTEMPELHWLLKAGISDDLQKSLSLDPENALRYFVLRRDNKNGLQCIVKEVREIAVQLRDRISEELWNYLSGFGAADMPDGAGAAALLPYLNGVLSDGAAVSGFMAESMTRGYEWRFQEIGSRVERAIRTLKLLHSMLVEVPSEEATKLLLRQALLEVGDGTMTYHRRYGGRLQVIPILDLLLCDESNPRSVAYQVSRLRAEAEHLPNNASSEAIFSPLDRDLLRLLTELRLADLEKISTPTGFKRLELEALVFNAIAALERVAEQINRLYLNHAPRSGVVHAMATEV